MEETETYVVTDRLTNSIPDPMNIVRIAALECQIADLWERLRILEALHDQARQPLKRELGL